MVERNAQIQLTAYIQIQADTCVPFIPPSNYQLYETRTLAVTEGVTLTFRRAGDGAPLTPGAVGFCCSRI